MTEIHIVEAITDGEYGCPLDRIVEIGICKANIETGIVESLYSEKVFLEPGSFTKKQKAFLLEKHHLTPEDLKDGCSLEEIVERTMKVLRGTTVTSFDSSVTIGKFLAFEPWDISKEMSVMSSVSSLLPKPVVLDEKLTEKEKIITAYRMIFPDDEHCVGDGESALDLAIKTGYILIKLWNLKI